MVTAALATLVVVALSHRCPKRRPDGRIVFLLQLDDAVAHHLVREPRIARAQTLRDLLSNLLDELRTASADQDRLLTQLTLLIPMDMAVLLSTILGSGRQPDELDREDVHHLPSVTVPVRERHFAEAIVVLTETAGDLHVDEVAHVDAGLGHLLGVADRQLAVVANQGRRVTVVINRRLSLRKEENAFRHLATLLLLGDLALHLLRRGQRQRGEAVGLRLLRITLLLFPPRPLFETLGGVLASLTLLLLRVGGPRRRLLNRGELLVLLDRIDQGDPQQRDRREILALQELVGDLDLLHQLRDHLGVIASGVVNSLDPGILLEIIEDPLEGPSHRAVLVHESGEQHPLVVEGLRLRDRHLVTVTGVDHLDRGALGVLLRHDVSSPFSQFVL